MVRSLPHKWNPEFQDGIKVGKIRVSLIGLDLIKDWRETPDLTTTIDLIRKLEKLFNDNIPN